MSKCALVFRFNLGSFAVSWEAAGRFWQGFGVAEMLITAVGLNTR